MRREPRAFLWDVRESADKIAGFVEGRSIEDYTSDEMLRAAVERHLEIIGEALSQLSKIAPGLAARLPQLRQAVGLRNILIHGCATVDDQTIWRIVQENLPPLRERVVEVLKETE